MSDRLYIDKKKNDEIVKKTIDKVDMLRLKSNGERVDIYKFAFALGVNSGKRTPSTSSEGFILEHVAKGKRSVMPNIYSVAVEVLRETNEENKIADTDVVYQIAEEYVNTGLEIINELIPNTAEYSEENMIYHFIELLDVEYSKIMQL